MDGKWLKNLSTSEITVVIWGVIANVYSLDGEAWQTTVQFSHSAMSTLCALMNRSTPGLPVHHQLLESTQTHVHWVDNAIQPSHRLSSPSPPALNLFQHQGLFQWVSSSCQVAKVLEIQLQHQSWVFISCKNTKITLAGEQPLKGGCWNPPKNKYPMFRDKGETTTRC